MSLVLDSSVALAWVYQDETSTLASEVMRRVVAAGAWVPALWRIEIANGLRTGLRRGRIDIDERDLALAELELLALETDAESYKHAWGATLRLSDRLGITPYDATYIELAQRKSLPLASLDIRLCNAARAVGIAVIGD